MLAMSRNTAASLFDPLLMPPPPSNTDSRHGIVAIDHAINAEVCLAQSNSLHAQKVPVAQQ